MDYPNTPHEEVTKQLRDLERQGGGMARFAHWSAGALLVAFSLGSLLSISHAAFITFLARWNAGELDIPDGISLIVNILLVLAADVALLYAASVLRVLNAAEAPAKEKRIHKWAMWGASILESSTYLYLAWEFDRPTTAFLWAIMISRAVASPLFAAYLSMARAIPVGPGDVAYHASLASGKGVVRDIAVLAADPDAPLSRKVKIYRASALMASHDRARFDGIVEAVSTPDSEAPAPYMDVRTNNTGAGYPEAPGPDPEPQGPGPRGRKNVQTEGEEEERRQPGPRGARRASVAHAPYIELTPDRPRRADSGRRSIEAQERWARETDIAAVILSRDPAISTRELARRMAGYLQHNIHAARATEIRRAVQPVRPSGEELAGETFAQDSEASA